VESRDPGDNGCLGDLRERQGRGRPARPESEHRHQPEGYPDPNDRLCPPGPHSLAASRTENAAALVRPDERASTRTSPALQAVRFVSRNVAASEWVMGRDCTGAHRQRRAEDEPRRS